MTERLAALHALVTNEFGCADGMHRELLDIAERLTTELAEARATIAVHAGMLRNSRRTVDERDATITRLTTERDNWLKLAIQHDGEMFQAGMKEGAADRLVAALDVEGQEQPAEYCDRGPCDLLAGHRGPCNPGRDHNPENDEPAEGAPTTCNRVMDGDPCRLLAGHSGYHRNGAGPFGPWMGEPRSAAEGGAS